MNPIWIIGAGGHAKDTCWLIRASGQFVVRGFVDRVGGATIRVNGTQLPVISDQDIAGLPQEDLLALGLGEPRLRLELGRRYREHRRFPNIIHPTVCGDHDGLEQGQGNHFCARVTYTTDILVGDFNLFNVGCIIGHDCTMGAGNVINPGAVISGNVKLGDGILIGTQATILQGVTIGDGVTVGAASLVRADVQEGITVVGVPAKPLVR